MPDVSIITALYNCVDLTRSYLDSLVETMGDHEWELILVDDVSTDGTRDYLKKLEGMPNLRIVLNESNLGFSASNNRGAMLANSPLLAFLNNDLVLTENWFEGMSETMQRAENPGIIGNIQINPNTGLLDHAGVFFGLDGMPRQARKNRKKRPQTDFTEWNAVTAACMLIKKEVFQQAGGFDESYRNGFEDIDLCVKLRKLGYRHYVANKYPILHCVSASPGRHKHNDNNSDIFEDRWADDAKQWGEQEWPSEYLKRYARHWWKLNLGKSILATGMLLKDWRHKKLTYRP